MLARPPAPAPAPPAAPQIRVGSSRDGVHVSALREIRALRELGCGGCSHVVSLLDVFPNKAGNSLCLVFEHLDWCARRGVVCGGGAGCGGMSMGGFALPPANCGPQTNASHLAQFLRGPCTPHPPPARSLEDVVRDRSLPLPPEAVKSYARQLLLALAHVHATGLVHRDVKPDNLLVDGATGVLKLADFGLARCAARGVRLGSCVGFVALCGLFGLGGRCASRALSGAPGRSAARRRALFDTRTRRHGRRAGRPTARRTATAAASGRTRCLVVGTARPSSFSARRATGRPSTCGRLAASSRS